MDEKLTKTVYMCERGLRLHSIHLRPQTFLVCSFQATYWSIWDKKMNIVCLLYFTIATINITGYWIYFSIVVH